MTQAADIEPRTGLGAGFWLAWTAAEAVLLAGFIAGIWFVKTQDVADWIGVVLLIGFTGAQLALAMAPQRLKVKRGIDQPMRAPMRRYLTRFMTAIMAYVVLLSLAVSYWQAAEPTGVIAVLVALAPGVAIVFAVRAVALLLKEEDDEYFRSRHVFAHVWATNATLALCGVYGFLEMFGLVPDMDLWVVFPLWALCLGPAQIAGKRVLG